MTNLLTGLIFSNRWGIPTSKDNLDRVHFTLSLTIWVTNFTQQLMTWHEQMIDLAQQIRTWHEQMIDLHPLLATCEIWMIDLHPLIATCEIWMIALHPLITTCEIWMITIHSLIATSEDHKSKPDWSNWAIKKIPQILLRGIFLYLIASLF